MCYYHPSDPCSSASLQPLVQYTVGADASQRRSVQPHKQTIATQTDILELVNMSSPLGGRQKALTQTVCFLSILGEMNRAKKLFHLPPDEPLICTAKVIMVFMFCFVFNFTNQYYKQHRSISWILNLHMPVLMTKELNLFGHVFSSSLSSLPD